MTPFQDDTGHERVSAASWHCPQLNILRAGTRLQSGAFLAPLVLRTTRRSVRPQPTPQVPGGPQAEPMGFSPDVHQISRCEREPIHLPAAIQPHGALLSLDGFGVVTQLAGDTRRAIGLVPEDLLGKPIDALVDSKGRALAQLMEKLDPPMPGYVAQWHPQPPGAGAWEITVHPKSKGAIIEFEPAAMPPAESARSISELARAIASLELPEEADAL